MPIDPDFPRNHNVIGKHSLADGETLSLCKAIKADQSNLEYHENSAGTFSEELAKGSSSIM